MSGPGLASLARERHRMSAACRGWTGGSRRPRRAGCSRCCPNWWSCVTRDTTPRHQTLPIGCAASPKIGPTGFARPSVVLAVQRDACAAEALSSRQPIGPTIDARLAAQTADVKTSTVGPRRPRTCGENTGGDCPARGHHGSVSGGGLEAPAVPQGGPWCRPTGAPRGPLPALAVARMRAVDVG